MFPSGNTSDASKSISIFYTSFVQLLCIKGEGQVQGDTELNIIQAVKTTQKRKLPELDKWHTCSREKKVEVIIEEGSEEY